MISPPVIHSVTEKMTPQGKNSKNSFKELARDRPQEGWKDGTGRPITTGREEFFFENGSQLELCPYS